MAIWNPLVVVPVADMAIMTWAQLCVFTAQPGPAQPSPLCTTRVGTGLCALAQHGQQRLIWTSQLACWHSLPLAHAGGHTHTPKY